MKRLITCLGLIATVFLISCGNNSSGSATHQALVKDHKEMEAAHDSMEATTKNWNAATKH